jgi:polyhydroxyalkanoate synthesis regulator phasin
MVDKVSTPDAGAAAATPPAAPTPRRGPGHRADMRDTVAEMAERAQLISQEAGSKIAGAMKDVIAAAAGLAGFAIESARDLTQYMVRRGQMTQEEADKLIREAEAAHGRKSPEERLRPTASKVAAEKAAAAKAAAAAQAATAPMAPPLRPITILPSRPQTTVGKAAASKAPPAAKAAPAAKPPAAPVKPAAAKAAAKPAPKAPARSVKPAARAAPARPAAKAGGKGKPAQGRVPARAPAKAAAKKAAKTPAKAAAHSKPAARGKATAAKKGGRR